MWGKNVSEKRLNLASVSYPWADVEKARKPVAASDDVSDSSELNKNLLDKAKYGLYPPGSSFKIITSIAALGTLTDVETVRFECKRLPNGRVGIMSEAGASQSAMICLTKNRTAVQTWQKN
jgi:cell division protein FtsI/penicillin-binding protein 2